MDPQNSGPNWSLCHDIESSVATEFSVFVAGLYCSMQFSTATYSLGLFLDYVATYFDNVATNFDTAILFLAQREYLMSRH